MTAPDPAEIHRRLAEDAIRGAVIEALGRGEGRRPAHVADLAADAPGPHLDALAAEIAALRVAVADLYRFAIHELDPDPERVEAYIVDPEAQKAARRAITLTAEGMPFRDVETIVSSALNDTGT